MKKQIAACAGMLLVAGCAAAADQATTVRSTELKAKPFSDAATLATLAQSSPVSVLERKASWLQVKSGASTGWVKMLSVRFNQVGPASKAGNTNSSLGVLFNVAQTGSGGSVATTGVKGISEELLRNPRPDQAALLQMQGYGATTADAQGFAKAGKLSRVQMNYVPEPGGRP